MKRQTLLAVTAAEQRTKLLRIPKHWALRAMRSRRRMRLPLTPGVMFLRRMTMPIPRRAPIMMMPVTTTLVIPVGVTQTVAVACSAGLAGFLAAIAMLTALILAGTTNKSNRFH